MTEFSKMYVKRVITDKLIASIKPNKALVLLGPRRVGKTSLLKELVTQTKEPNLFLNGEDFESHRLLENRTVKNYKNLLGETRLLIIDEAQKIPDIGIKLKLMIDEISQLKIIVTGSSAFDVHGQTGEPLTGRKLTLNLFPLSEKEFFGYEDELERRDNLLTRLVFGNYPELISIKNSESKIDYLKEIISSYLLKDILAFENIKNSSKILNLLRLISFQVGSEVSYQELATQLQISRNTVEKYLDLLSKVFVIYRVDGFSKNLRKEVVKNSKWYFYDNGIRNAIISNYNPISMRNDLGQLWENYLFSERIKFQAYGNIYANNFFWRTYDKQEIDMVEEREGKLFAYEFKWKSTKEKPPIAWAKAYEKSSFEVIDAENYFQFLGVR